MRKLLSRNRRLGHFLVVLRELCRRPLFGGFQGHRVRPVRAEDRLSGHGRSLLGSVRAVWARGLLP
jgi:hypothetical protein